MNHLAHFLLCPADDEARAGTLIADFSRGTDLSAFTSGVELGIRLHRRIDALVDASPEVNALKPLVMGSPLRRYAGILFDVFFDYALMREWHVFHPAARSQFNSDIYASLARTEAQMPAQARSVSARMRAYDALSSCATHEGCARTLARIATRLKRPVDLAAGIDIMIRHEAQITGSFIQLFPALQAGTHAYLAGSSLTMRPLELSVNT